jgi:hypothetical protein
MITRLSQIAGLVGLATLANAQPSARPDVPDAIKAPAGEELVLQAHASGAQIYTCRQGADGKTQWLLDGPEAQLRDQKGSVIGRHFAGPTWQHKDGSEVKGKAVAQVDSPDADSIPWLLVEATTHSGNGELARVTSIQRIHTKGGRPPAATDCDSSKLGVKVKSNYTADYYFFAPAAR